MDKNIIILILFILAYFIYSLIIIFRLKKEKDKLTTENSKLFREEKKFKEVEKVKAEFITTVAHQLRTPLTKVKWSLQSILKGDIGKISSDQKEVLQSGYEANEEMIKLVNDLLEIDKTEYSYLGYHFENVYLEMIISKAIQSFSPVAKQKKIDLEFYASEQPLPQVKADAYKLGLVLTNLLDNALDYTPAGGKIEVALKSLGDSAIVSVKDTGIGIPKEELQRAFTRFFRAENAMKVKTEGSGLGLFISKNIIEAHGGRIWVESETDKGTTFFFTIPF